uniref:Uncharacterized protein n=1 Tax=Anguilla anguilla TaxID=7936 RepID=A0A0E9Y1E8_ANGAN
MVKNSDQNRFAWKGHGQRYVFFHQTKPVTLLQRLQTVASRAWSLLWIHQRKWTPSQNHLIPQSPLILFSPFLLLFPFQYFSCAKCTGPQAPPPRR